MRRKRLLVLFISGLIAILAAPLFVVRVREGESILVALPFLLLLLGGVGAGLWRLDVKRRQRDPVAGAEFFQQWVIFRYSSGRALQYRYDDIDAVMATYADTHMDYSRRLLLVLFMQDGVAVTIRGMEASGEQVESVAQELRARVEAVNGEYSGSREEDRLARLAQRRSIRLTMRLSFLLVSAAFAVAAWVGDFETLEELAVIAEGVGTEGTVTELFHKRFYWVRYEYLDASGSRFSGLARQTKAEWDALRVNEGIALLYLPGKPEASLPARFFQRIPRVIRTCLLAGAAVFVFLFCLTLFGRDLSFARGRLFPLRRNELEEERLEREGVIIRPKE